jgi:hypothetical protein
MPETASETASDDTASEDTASETASDDRDGTAA